MELIRKWLEGNKNFVTGRILYNHYGSDAAIKQLIAKGETPAAKQQLIVAMQAIVKPVEKQKEAPVEVSFAKLPPGDDAICKAIHEDWKQHYTRMNMLRGKLQSFGDDNSPETVHHCNELCQQILEEERYINACWDKLKHYQEHGKLPEAKAEETFTIPGDPVALGKLIESIKRNIRRNRQKATTDPTNPLYPALIKKYEEQLKQVSDGITKAAV